MLHIALLYYRSRDNHCHPQHHSSILILFSLPDISDQFDHLITNTPFTAALSVAEDPIDRDSSDHHHPQLYETPAPTYQHDVGLRTASTTSKVRGSFEECLPARTIWSLLSGEDESSVSSWQLQPGESRAKDSQGETRFAR